MPVVPPPPPSAPVARTAYKDMTRSWLRAAKLSGGQKTMLGIWMRKCKEGRPSIWTGGREPLPFDDFFLAVRGRRMTARQHWVFESSNCLRAADIFSPRRKVQEFVLVWGKGCLAPESRLTHALTGETCTVEEWAKRGCPLWVRSLDPSGRDCVMPSSPVYRKGRARIFLVELADGRKFRATADHRCLTPQGWRNVRDLAAGYSRLRCRPLTGGGISRAEDLAEDDHSPYYTTVTEITQEGVSDFYDLTVAGTSCYYDAGGVLHHNSGKGFLSATFNAWIAYVLCSVAPHYDPALVVNSQLAPRTPLVCMNVAPDQNLARQVYFKYLREAMGHPLLKQFTPDVLSDEVRFYRADPYGGKYEFLSLYSKHSNASGIDGHNLILFVGDEVDAFEVTSDGLHRGKEIHDILRSSASTRMGTSWLGFMISYPRTEDGFLMGLRERALKDIDKNGDASAYFVDTAATWDVRPDVSRALPTIAEDYQYDPRGAMSKYECIPLAVEEGFFEFPERIDESIDKARVPVARWRPTVTVKRNGADGELKEYVSADLLSVTPKPGREYFLGADGGVSGDLFAVSVWSIDATADTGAAWVCPACAQERSQEASGSGMGHSGSSSSCSSSSGLYAPFTDIALGRVGIAASLEDMQGGRAPRPECGLCLSRADVSTVRDPGTGAVSVRVNLQGWHKRVQSEAEEMASLSVNGEAVAVPRMSCDLVITLLPVQKKRSTDTIRTVDFDGAESIVRGLIEGLGIKRAFFDPYQLVGMVQRLQGVAGCHCESKGFGNSDQMRRARFAKALLYTGTLRFFPFRMPAPEQEAKEAGSHGAENIDFIGEWRQREEWRKVQRKGGRIDHPKKGSKDIFDADMLAIWAAATHTNSRLEAIWLE